MGNLCAEPQHKGGQKVITMTGDLKSAKTPSDTAATVGVTTPPQPAPVTPEVKGQQEVASTAAIAQVFEVTPPIAEKPVEPKVTAPQTVLEVKKATVVQEQ